MLISGQTRVAGVIGSPVAHSLSPVIHNAAFAATGLDWVFVAFDVDAGEAGVAIEGMRALGIDGLSVTMPHKEAVAGAVDRCSADAAALEAANCIVREGATLIGENTDGAGFLDALRLDVGFEPEGRRCVVFGAGGAARAVIRALALAGASDVIVVNRTASRGARAAQLGGAVGRVGRAEEAGDAELIVNATPVGMTAAGCAVPAAALGPGQLVADLVYEPAVTPLLSLARERGATAVNGLGMLIHQAAHAFRHWTGEDPPVEAMSAAAVAHLASEAPR